MLFHPCKWPYDWVNGVISHELKRPLLTTGFWGSILDVVFMLGDFHLWFRKIGLIGFIG